MESLPRCTICQAEYAPPVDGPKTMRCATCRASGAIESLGWVEIWERSKRMQQELREGDQLDREFQALMASAAVPDDDA